MIEEASIHCPYCGEQQWLEIDCSAGSQRYTEDCQVCCQPMLVTTEISAFGELLGVQAEAENE